MQSQVVHSYSCFLMWLVSFISYDCNLFFDPYVSRIIKLTRMIFHFDCTWRSFFFFLNTSMFSYFFSFKEIDWKDPRDSHGISIRHLKTSWNIKIEQQFWRRAYSSIVMHATTLPGCHNRFNHPINPDVMNRSFSYSAVVEGREERERGPIPKLRLYRATANSGAVGKSV